MINSEANNEVINYDVHGISRIQSNLAGIVPSVFQVNQIKGNIDLIFKILYDGKSEVGGAHRSSHKLFLKDLSANTKVYYFVNRMLRGIYCMLHDFPAPWLQYVITNILIPLKLLQKGYSFVHAACLDSCDEGSLIIAPPNTGKTHTALFLNRTGFNYLSDDMTIIKGNKAYCYPTDLTVTPFHIKEFDISYVWKEHLKMITRRVVNQIPYLNACEGIRVDPKRVVHNLRMETVVRNVCFLDNGPDCVRELEYEVAFKKMIAASYEIQFQSPVIYSYLYKNADEELDLEKLSDLRNKIYRDVLRGSRLFSVTSRKHAYPQLIMDAIYET